MNCRRMNQDCIFQPASSSSTAVFVHVSAVPGGIAPGTPLYGAYGQPLPGGRQAPPDPPPPLGPPHQAAQFHLPHHAQSSAYPQTAPRSLTDLHSPYSELDAVSSGGRRRRQEPEEADERGPSPPNGSEEEPWERSLIFNSNSPRAQDYASQPPMPALPDRVASTRTPPVSSKDPTPPQPLPATPQPGAECRNSTKQG